MKDNSSAPLWTWSALLFVCLTSTFAVAQEQKTASATFSAPLTGTYAPYVDPKVLEQRAARLWWDLYLPNPPPLFTVTLETNGTYVAEAPNSPPNTSDMLAGASGRPHVQRGTWHWDAEKQEFRLTPGQFDFYIERLPLDKEHTNRLVWGASWLVREESK
jgi:hypothetical protein